MKKNNKRPIVMADDDPEDFMIVRDVLEENGFENDFHHCSDGRDLMDYLRRQGKYKNPAKHPLPGIILLDLNMPGMSGGQALTIIKQADMFHHIPVIILSTSSDPMDIEFCFQSGANAYVEKSHNYDLLSCNLINTLQNWISGSAIAGMG